MQPYGYQVPRTLGWGALGEDLPGGIVYAPPTGWTLRDAPQLVTSTYQESMGTVVTQNCSVLAQAVLGTPLPDGTPMYLPPLGWYVASITDANGVDAVIWIDPSSMVAHNLSNCSTAVQGSSDGTINPSLGWVFILAAIAGGALLFSHYAGKQKFTSRKPRAARRKRPRKR
jgi:hypothetical protein